MPLIQLSQSFTKFDLVAAFHTMGAEESENGMNLRDLGGARNAYESGRFLSFPLLGAFRSELNSTLDQGMQRPLE